MGARRRLRRPRLRDPQGRRVGRPDRQEPRRGGHEPRSPRRWASAPTTASSSPPARKPRRPSSPGSARTRVAEQLDLIEKGAFRFCWIVDFPMFEYNEEQKKIDFSHNPFSMPQGGMEALETKDPLDILAWQYDIVCNGVELSSGAIRNHRPDIMYKAFEIAGYTQRGGRHELLGHDQRLQVRRAAARRLGAGHRPHRHAARRRAEHPRGDPLPDEPEGRGPDDERAGARSCPKQLKELHIKVVLPRLNAARIGTKQAVDRVTPIAACAAALANFVACRSRPSRIGALGAALREHLASCSCRRSPMAAARSSCSKGPKARARSTRCGSSPPPSTPAISWSIRLRFDRREASRRPLARALLARSCRARATRRSSSAAGTAAFSTTECSAAPTRTALPRAFDEINEFEAQQRDYGTLIVKLYFDVSAEVQEQRLARARGRTRGARAAPRRARSAPTIRLISARSRSCEPIPTPAGRRGG